MASASHPGAMAPPKPGSTRTAAPRKPASWGSSRRMRIYTLFGATGFIYLVVAILILEMIWQLGAGPEAWSQQIDRLYNPFYIAFHFLALASVVFVGVRFFRLFPKAQPANIGPLKPPPRPVILAMLYAVWIGLTVVFSLILAGVLF